MDRYFEINRRADERIRKELGREAVTQYNLTQQIVFSAQKACSPWTSGDPACYAVPQSTLAKHVYGSQTDKTTNGGAVDYSKNRPRFLSAGLMMGNVKAVRALYNEVSDRMSHDDSLQTDQQVFSQIFGEQNVHREIVRRQFTTWRQNLASWFVTDARVKLFKQEHIDKVSSRGQSLEFGIGLDYESALGFATDNAHEDAAWVSFNKPAQLQAASKGESRIGALQKDISYTLPPFWTFTEEPVNRSRSWEDVPLLANAYTGIVPATVQHNGKDALRKEWWGKMWFQKNARTLFSAHINAPRGVVAVAGSNVTRAWWGTDDWRGGARNVTGQWFRYDVYCKGTENEMFRDGKGVWDLGDDY